MSKSSGQVGCIQQLSSCPTQKWTPLPKYDEADGVTYHVIGRLTWHAEKRVAQSPRKGQKGNFKGAGGGMWSLNHRLCAVDAGIMTRVRHTTGLLPI